MKDNDMAHTEAKKAEQIMGLKYTVVCFKIKLARSS
jgi:hypothetical protein